MTITKGDSLADRIEHAFGLRAIKRELGNMMYRNPLDHLTDEARDELLHRLICDLKFTRKINAANRKLRKA